jgi:hypothetical protein
MKIKATYLYFMLLTFCVTSVTQAAPRYWGVDALGMGAWEQSAVNAIPSGIAIGLFTQKDLFGDPIPKLERKLALGHTPLVRYNLRWSDAHQFPTSVFPKIVEEAKRVTRTIDKFPSVECYVSGATEHQLNARDAQALADKILAVIPERCKYVNNPWTGKGAFLAPTNRIINEVHGSHAEKPRVGGIYTFSFDGTDCFDVFVTPIKNKLHDADVFFFWTSQNNGRKNANDKTPRPQRRAYPVAKLVIAQAFLRTEQGNVKLPNKYTVKPKSDQHQVPPEPRALKPVFILPRAGERIKVRANGKTFQSSEGQAFNDGRTRYYFGIYGYEMVEQAGTNVFEVLGQRRKEVVQNGKKKIITVDGVLGTTNPAFRQGTSR